MKIILENVPQRFENCFLEDGSVRAAYLTDCVCNPVCKLYNAENLDKTIRYKIKAEIIERLVSIAPMLRPEHSSINVLVDANNKICAEFTFPLNALVACFYLQRD